MISALAWVVYLLAATLQLICQALNWPVGAGISQAVLAPSLIVVVLSSAVPRGRLRGWTLAALAFSFAGDMLPKFVPNGFDIYAMIAGFFVAQVCWIVGLWPLRRRARPIRARWQLPIYLLIGVVIVGLCLPSAGALAPAVVLYAVVVIAMAILASSLGPIGQLGGIFFVISDGLIAIVRFVPWLNIPYAGVWIMFTYSVALAALVYATVKHNAASGLPR